ncbi:MAG: DUF1810 family protein [Tidjanibacter sp.]|nr:DUF1810 family protein [Tidjanibacter sp.]
MPYDCEERIYGMSNIWEAKEFLTNERNAKRSEELLTALLKHDRKVFDQIIPPTQRVNLAISLLYLGNIIPNPLYEKVITKFYGGRKNATTLAIYSLVLRDLHRKLQDESELMKTRDSSYFQDVIFGTITDAKGVPALLNSVPDQEDFARKFMHLNDVAYKRYYDIRCKLDDEISYSDVDSYRARWIEFAKWLVGEIYSRISRQENIARTLVPALADHIIIWARVTNMSLSIQERIWGPRGSSIQHEPIISVFCTPWFRDTLRKHTFPLESIDNNMTTRLRNGRMIKELSRPQHNSRMLDEVSCLIESPQVQALMAELDAEDDE